jgi:predicted double-glycine peptidase
MIVFDLFDELMLRHDVCSFSFLEIHTWIKKSIKHTWKAWRTKKVDWGPSPSIPNVLHQATTSLLAQGKKEIESNIF